jgi:hypothetical protein
MIVHGRVSHEEGGEKLSHCHGWSRWMTYARQRPTLDIRVLMMLVVTPGIVRQENELLERCGTTHAFLAPDMLGPDADPKNCPEDRPKETNQRMGIHAAFSKTHKATAAPTKQSWQITSARARARLDEQP